MKTTATEVRRSRNHSNGYSPTASNRRYAYHRRRGRPTGAAVALDRIPELVLPELHADKSGFSLTAAEVEADLFYGRD